MEIVIAVLMSFMVMYAWREATEPLNNTLDKKQRYAKQKHLGYKKRKANQKQQLSDYSDIATYTCN